jgi:hypothetical protein
MLELTDRSGSVLKRYVLVSGLLTFFLCSHLIASDGIYFSMELFYSSVPRDLERYQVVKKFPARTRYCYDIQSVEIEYHNGSRLCVEKNIRRTFDIRFDMNGGRVVLSFKKAEISKKICRITLNFRES